MEITILPVGPDLYPDPHHPETLVIPAGKHVAYGVGGDILIEGCPSGQDSYFQTEGATNLRSYAVKVWIAEEPRSGIDGVVERTKSVLVSDTPFQMTQFFRNYAYLGVEFEAELPKRVRAGDITSRELSLIHI